MEVFPNCEECPSNCPLGGWNGGSCGAQHIMPKSLDECGGAYQYVSTSPNKESYEFKCDVCGNILTKPASWYGKKEVV